METVMKYAASVTVGCNNLFKALEDFQESFNSYMSYNFPIDDEDINSARIEIGEEFDIDTIKRALAKKNLTLYTETFSGTSTLKAVLILNKGEKALEEFVEVSVKIEKNNRFNLYMLCLELILFLVSGSKDNTLISKKEEIRKAIELNPLYGSEPTTYKFQAIYKELKI